MKDLAQLEAYATNLVRVYGARNENDLMTIMQTVVEIVQYARSLQDQIDVLQCETNYTDGRG